MVFLLVVRLGDLSLEGWLGVLEVRVGKGSSSEGGWGLDDSLWGRDDSGDDWLLDVLDWLGLLDVLDGLDWLLDNLLDWLLDDWLVDNLSLDGLVLDSLLGSLLWDVLDVLVIVDLGDVLSLVLNGVVVGDLLLLWDVLSGVDWLLDGLVLDLGSFVWDVLNSGFSLDWGSNLGLDNLDWLLDNLDWLLDDLNWLLDVLDWLLDVLDWLGDVLDWLRWEDLRVLDWQDSLWDIRWSL